MSRWVPVRLFFTLDPGKHLDLYQNTLSGSVTFLLAFDDPAEAEFVLPQPLARLSDASHGRNLVALRRSCFTDEPTHAGRGCFFAAHAGSLEEKLAALKIKAE